MWDGMSIVVTLTPSVLEEQRVLAYNRRGGAASAVETGLAAVCISNKGSAIMWKQAKVLLVAMTVLLTACGWPQPTPSVFTPNVKRATIIFAVPDWELQGEQINRQVKEFEAQNPNIHIQLKPFSEILGLASMEEFTVMDDFWLKIASGADTFQVLFLNGIDRRAVRDGLVRDLKPFVDADTNFRPNDFYPGALDAAAWEGGMWAMPTALDYELIWFDKEACEVAGVAYPETGWTWSDFSSKACALTEHDGDQTTRWGFVPSVMTDLVQLLQLRGGPLLDYTITPPVPRFTDPEIVQSTRWLADLVQDHVIPVPFSAGLANAVSLQEGTAAMEAGTAFMRAAYSRDPRLGVVPYPVDAPDSKTTPIYFAQVAMSAGTSHPEAAWRWMDFLSRQSPSQPGWVPARSSVAETTGFWDSLDEELTLALRFAMNHSCPFSLAGWDVVHEILDTQLRTILSGEKSVEEALAAAQSQALVDLEAEAAQRAAATPASPVVVATTEPEAAEDAVTITFMPAGDIVNLEAFRDAARRFHAAHPGVVVEVKNPGPTPGGIASLAGQADCFQSIFSLDTPGALTAIYNLEPLLNADPAFDLTDFFPSLLVLYRREGQLWGIPAEVHPYVIEYNQTLFDAEGQMYPTSDWTTDDFLALAQSLTQGQGKDKQYGFVSTSELLDLLVFLQRQGGQILDDTQDPPAAAFDDPATIEAVKWYADLSLLYGVKPVCTTAGECEALIQASRAAIWGRPFERHGEPEADILPFPKGPGGSGSPILSSSGYFISARATAPQSCWEWIKFLGAEADNTQGLPARRSVALSREYQDRVGAELAAAYLTSVEGNQKPSNLQHLTSQEGMDAYLVWLEQAYTQIIDGEAPQRALGEAQRKADEYRACVVAAGAARDHSVGQRCREQVDPSLNSTDER